MIIKWMNYVVGCLIDTEVVENTKRKHKQSSTQRCVSETYVKPHETLKGESDMLGGD